MAFERKLWLLESILYDPRLEETYVSDKKIDLGDSNTLDALSGRHQHRLHSSDITVVRLWLVDS